MILCDLRNIELSFGTKELFKGARLSILKGDRIGLLGLNGSGKSSLFKILNGSVTPDPSTPPFVFDKFRGDEKNPPFSSFLIPQSLPVIEDPFLQQLRNFYLYFHPSLYQTFKELESVEAEIEHNHQNEDLIHKQKRLLDQVEHERGWELSKRYESYLKFFNHTNLDRNINELSGGEQKKVLLAIGFSTFAPLILWDEPTNHLDIETIARFEEELVDSEKTFMLITHDRYLLSKVCTKIFHIKKGILDQFVGNYEAYLTYLSSEDAKRKIQLEKMENRLRRETEWIRRGVKARRTKAKSRIEDYYTLSSSVEDLARNEYKKISLNLGQTDDQRKILLKAENLSFSYGEKEIVKSFSTVLYRGHKIGLLGKNGIGKSTLVKLFTGELTPSSGKTSVPKEIAVTYFSQNRDALNLEVSPYDLICDGTDYVETPMGRMHIISYLEKFLFKKEEIYRPIKSFSGGEQNRLLLAKNLTRGADLWIFDEPTNDLDLESLEIFEQVLKEFKGTFILISHDRAFLANVTNRVWFLTDEKKLEIFNGGFEQVEAYLDLMRIQKELQKELEEEKRTQQAETVLVKTEITTKQAATEVKLSNKDKLRVKDIPTLLPKKEKRLEVVTALLANFDFSSMSSEKQKEYEALSKEREQIEEDIIHIYEDVEKFGIKLA